MNINAAELGKNIIAEILNDPAPGFYPGGFKPPHKGHLEVALDAASRNYITNLTIIIGKGVRDGINADQSKAIWDIYLEAYPNQKIDVKIADKNSPIADIFDYLGKDVDNKAYVIGGRAETVDQNYFVSLEDKFGDRVRAVAIDEKFVDENGNRVSASSFRTTIATLKTQVSTIENTQKGTPDYNKAVSDYNNTYDYFKSLFPSAVIEKGFFKKILNILNLNIPTPESLNESITEYKNKSKLNPNIFSKDDRLKPNVRQALLKIADTFWDKLDLGQEYDDVTLTGSSANYNWGPNSDIDLHIIVDFSKFGNPKLVRKLFDQAEANWNSKYKLKIKNNPIAPYVQDSEGPHRSTGVYSVLNNDWIEKPVYQKVEISDDEINKKANPFKKIIDQLSKSTNPDKALDKIETLKEKLKNFRETGLDRDGEYSIENLAFKELRNSGYLEKLANVKQYLTSKKLSKDLNENKEDVVNSFVKFASNFLELTNIPSIEFIGNGLFSDNQPSFGGFYPDKNKISVNNNNRNIIDVLRTLGHELVHAKQNELEPLSPEDGATGSPYENEANAAAGILMRLFARQNPEIFQLNEIEDKPIKYIIFCDMDGVLVDFDQGYKDLTDKSTKHVDVQDKDNFWSEFRQGLSDENMSEKDYWANLKPLSDGMKLWDIISKYNPYILTAPSLNRDESKAGKQEWVDEHLNNVKKVYFASAKFKPKFAGKNKILIDDRKDTTDEWSANGGIGIHYTSLEDTLEKLEKLGLYDKRNTTKKGV